jgi:hypothetical protein
MAVLTSTGISFSDGTSASSRSSFFSVAGTIALFFESSAPTGWTQVTTQNDKALRVVSGTGGGAAGTNSFSATFANISLSATVPVAINGLSVSATTIDINTIPSHSHPANLGGNIAIGNASPSLSNTTASSPGTTTGNNGGGGSHTHPITFTSASGPWSTSVDMRVQYIDTIICSFNG